MPAGAPAPPCSRSRAKPRRRPSPRTHRTGARSPWRAARCARCRRSTTKTKNVRVGGSSPLVASDRAFLVTVSARLDAGAVRGLAGAHAFAVAGLAGRAALRRRVKARGLAELVLRHAIENAGLRLRPREGGERQYKQNRDENPHVPPPLLFATG